MLCYLFGIWCTVVQPQEPFSIVKDPRECPSHTHGLKYGGPVSSLSEVKDERDNWICVP